MGVEINTEQVADKADDDPSPEPRSDLDPLVQYESDFYL